MEVRRMPIPTEPLGLLAQMLNMIPMAALRYVLPPPIHILESPDIIIKRLGFVERIRAKLMRKRLEDYVKTVHEIAELVGSSKVQEVDPLKLKEIWVR